MTSLRPVLLPRISFPGRPSFIQLVPGGQEDVPVKLLGEGVARGVPDALVPAGHDRHASHCLCCGRVFTSFFSVAHPLVPDVLLNVFWENFPGWWADTVDTYCPSRPLNLQRKT